MLIRHILSYLLAQGLPGVVNFLALVVYTRLLTSEQFGRYSVVIAVTGLIHVVFFQWLELVCARFVPAHADNPEVVLRPILGLFLGLCAICLVGAAIILIWASPSLWLLVLVATMLLITTAWHELNLKYAAAQLAPTLYGVLGAVRAVLAILIGATLAWIGWGAQAPLIGLAIGAVVAWLVAGRKAWVEIKPTIPNSEQIKLFATYGVPLAGVFSLIWIMASSDRLIIAMLLGEKQTGFYSVGYDLAQQTLILLLSIVNTAATPIAIRLFETKGVELARVQMKQNGEIMFALAFAGSAGLVVIAPAMIELFVGEEFRDGALTVFPWIAASAGIVGIKAFYFDIAFHISRKSKWLLVTSGIAAVANIILNFMLIPTYGIIGAAWAAILAYLLAAISSYILGRQVFSMPGVIPLLVHGLAPALAVYVIANLGMHLDLPAIYRMVVSIAIGGVAASVTSICLNTANVRSIIKNRLHVIF